VILNSYSSTSVYMHLQYLLYRRYLIKVRASLIKGTMESPRGAQTRLGSRLASLHAQETPRAHTAARALAKLRRPTPDGPVHQGEDGGDSLTGGPCDRPYYEPEPELL
jgi:hypothetical protein